MRSARQACLFGWASLIAIAACNLVTGIGNLSEVPCTLDCGTEASGKDSETADMGTPERALMDTGCKGLDACVSPPAGWTFVALNASGRAGCPLGFGPEVPVVVDPGGGPSTCMCMCNLVIPPSCRYGTVDENIGSDTTCGGGFHLLNANACTAITPGDLSPYHSMVPLPADGGSCSPAMTAGPPDGGTLGLTCKLDSTKTCAAGSTCPFGVSHPFELCVTQSGHVACPHGFPAVHRTASRVTPGGCTGCECGAAPTADCADAAYSFFVTADCGTLLGTMPANGECLPTVGSGMFAASSSYFARVADASCPSPTQAPTPSDAVLEDEATVCCP